MIKNVKMAPILAKQAGVYEDAMAESRTE